MGTMDTLARLSELFGFGKKTRAYAADQEGSGRRALTGLHAKDLSLESLEPRILLMTYNVLVAPGEFVAFDMDGPAGDEIGVVANTGAGANPAPVIAVIDDGGGVGVPDVAGAVADQLLSLHVQGNGDAVVDTWDYAIYTNVSVPLLDDDPTAIGTSLGIDNANVQLVVGGDFGTDPLLVSGTDELAVDPAGINLLVTLNPANASQVALFNQINDAGSAALLVVGANNLDVGTPVVLADIDAFSGNVGTVDLDNGTGTVNLDGTLLGNMASSLDAALAANVAGVTAGSITSVAISGQVVLPGLGDNLGIGASGNILAVDIGAQLQGSQLVIAEDPFGVNNRAVLDLTAGAGAAFRAQYTDFALADPAATMTVTGATAGGAATLNVAGNAAGLNLGDTGQVIYNSVAGQDDTFTLTLAAGGDLASLTVNNAELQGFTGPDVTGTNITTTDTDATDTDTGDVLGAISATGGAGSASLGILIFSGAIEAGISADDGITSVSAAAIAQTAAVTIGANVDGVDDDGALGTVTVTGPIGTAGGFTLTLDTDGTAGNNTAQVRPIGPVSAQGVARVEYKSGGNVGRLTVTDEAADAGAGVANTAEIVDLVYSTAAQPGDFAGVSLASETGGGGPFADVIDFIPGGGVTVPGNLTNNIQIVGADLNTDEVRFTGTFVVNGSAAVASGVTVDAGMGIITGTFQVDADTVGTPVAVWSQDRDNDGVAEFYVLDVDGTFTAGVLAYVTVWSGQAADATIAVTDIDGTTALANTDLIFATRLTSVDPAATDVDDEPTVQWNVLGIVAGGDPDVETHDFRRILIEGDLRGDLGGDALLGDGNVSDPLGVLDFLQVQNQWWNNVAPTPSLSTVYLTDLNVGFSAGALTTLPPDTDQDSDLLLASFELNAVLVPTTTTNQTITLPAGIAGTQTIVGIINSASQFSTFQVTDNSSDGGLNIVNAINFDATGGVLGDVDLIGEAIGLEIEYDTSNPASFVAITDANTNIRYNVDPAYASQVQVLGQNAADYLEIESPIGNVDFNATGTTLASLGNAIIGYDIAMDGASDMPADPANLIGDANGAGGLLQLLVQDAGNPAAAIMRAGMGTLNVQGRVNALVTSGNVSSVTTDDNSGATSLADFGDLVIDGRVVGATAIDGDLYGSLVTGDPAVTALGADNALGGGGVNADTVGLVFTSANNGFGADISIAGNAGGSAATIGDITTSVAPTVETFTFTGDIISEPYTLAYDVIVTGDLNAAVASGASTNTTGVESDNFDVNGNIQAANIYGDLWAGDDFNGSVTATASDIAGGVDYLIVTVGVNVAGVISDGDANVDTYTLTISRALGAGTAAVSETEPNDNPLATAFALADANVWGEAVASGAQMITITGTLGLGDHDVFLVPSSWADPLGLGELVTLANAASSNQALTVAVFDSGGAGTDGTITNAIVSATAAVGGGAVAPVPGPGVAGRNATAANPVLEQTATGASPGDITADMIAPGNMIAVLRDAGTGTGGSILANTIAGTSGAGSMINVNLEADEDIGDRTGATVYRVAADDDLISVALLAGWDSWPGAEPFTNADSGGVFVQIAAGAANGDPGPTITAGDTEGDFDSSGAITGLAIDASGDVGFDTGGPQLFVAATDAITGLTINSGDLAGGSLGLASVAETGPGGPRASLRDATDDTGVFVNVDAGIQSGTWSPANTVGLTIASQGQVGRAVEGENYIRADGNVSGAATPTAIINAGDADNEQEATVAAGLPQAEYDESFYMNILAGLEADGSLISTGLQSAITGLQLRADDDVGTTAQDPSDGILASGNVGTAATANSINIAAGEYEAGVSALWAANPNTGAAGFTGGSFYMNVAAGHGLPIGGMMGVADINNLSIRVDDEIGAPAGADGTSNNNITAEDDIVGFQLVAGDAERASYEANIGVWNRVTTSDTVDGQINTDVRAGLGGGSSILAASAGFTVGRTASMIPLVMAGGVLERVALITTDNLMAVYGGNVGVPSGLTDVAAADEVQDLVVLADAQDYTPGVTNPATIVGGNALLDILAGLTNGGQAFEAYNGVNDPVLTVDADGGVLRVAIVTTGDAGAPDQVVVGLPDPVQDQLDDSDGDGLGLAGRNMIGAAEEIEDVLIYTGLARQSGVTGAMATQLMPGAGSDAQMDVNAGMDPNVSNANHTLMGLEIWAENAVGMTAEGFNYVRADGNVGPSASYTLSLVAGESGQMDSVRAALTQGGNSGQNAYEDINGTYTGSDSTELVLYNVLSGVEITTNGTVTNNTPTVGRTPIQTANGAIDDGINVVTVDGSNITSLIMLADDGVGQPGQEDRSGVIATGNLMSPTFAAGTYATAWARQAFLAGPGLGVAGPTGPDANTRASLSGFSDLDTGGPAVDDFDDGGSVLINAVAGAGGLQVATAAGVLPSPVNIAGTGFIDPLMAVADDSVGEDPNVLPSDTQPTGLNTYAAGTGNMISAAGRVDVGVISAGMSFTSFITTSTTQPAPSSAASDAFALRDLDGDGDMEAIGPVGDLNMDVIAGNREGVLPLPVRGNINDIPTGLGGVGALPQLDDVNASILLDDTSIIVGASAVTMGVDAVGLNAIQGGANTQAGVGQNLLAPNLSTTAPFVWDDPNTDPAGDGHGAGDELITEGNGNWNATWVAAANVNLDQIGDAAYDVYINGNLLGRDGLPGRAIIAAASFTGATFAAPNVLNIGSLVANGTFRGSLNAGSFVPFDTDFGNIDNNWGNFQAGTVLTLAELQGTMTVGRIDASLNGNNDNATNDGITIGEVLEGAEGLADAAFLGTTTFSSTDDSLLTVNIVGRPLVPIFDPVTGAIMTQNNQNVQYIPGDEANRFDGDALNISWLSFGGIIPAAGNNVILANDQLDINFMISNADAVTAIDTDDGTVGAPGDPSHFTTNLPFNAGQPGANQLADINGTIRSNGWGEGGIDIGVLAAGFDPFVLIDMPTAAEGDVLGDPNVNFPPASNRPDAVIGALGNGYTVSSVGMDQAVSGGGWEEAFGYGNLNGANNTLVFAADADPTNGLEVGDIEFGVVAAGQNIAGRLIAQDDVVAQTDASLGSLPGGADLDIAAGLSAVRSIAPVADAGLAPGGNIGVNAGVYAGDDITRDQAGGFTGDDLMSIVAIGGDQSDNNAANDTGIIGGVFVSGAEDQIAVDPLIFQNLAANDLETDGETTTATDINAVFVASNDITAVIEAGNITVGAHAVTAGGLGQPAGGFDLGSFTGGVIAGAGVDLDIYDAADNVVAAVAGQPAGGSFTGSLRALNQIDVSVANAFSPTGGILVEGSITNAILAGFGVDGGSIVGDIIAEEDINHVIASADVGVDDDLLMAGGTIGVVQAGNPVGGIAGVGFPIHDASLMIGDSGVIESDIFAGNGLANVATAAIGAGEAINGNIALGTNAGIAAAAQQRFRVAADRDVYGVDRGVWIMFVEAGNFEGTVAQPFGAVDMIVNQGAAAVNIGVDAPVGTGTGASVRSLLIGDALLAGSTINIEDGSLGWLGVADDVPGLSDYIDARLVELGFDFATLPAFFTSSIPVEGAVEATFNNDEPRVDADVDISVSDDFGIPDGLHTEIDPAYPAVQGQLATLVENGAGTNADFYVEGTLTGSNITVHNGDMGDVYAGLNITTTTITAYGSIGEVVGNDNVGGLTLNAITGGIGGVAAAHGAQTGTITMTAYLSVGESDWNENGVADVAEDLNGDGYIMPALSIAEGPSANVTIESTAGDVGDIIFEGTITGPTNFRVDALTGSVGKIHSRVGDIDNVVIRAGGSFLGMIAENGDIRNPQIHVQDDVLQLYASNGIILTGAEAGILAERGNIGNIYTETGDITGSQNGDIVAGGSVGDIVAPVGQITDLEVIAGDSVGSIYGGNGIEGSFEAKTGNLATDNNPHPKDIWAFVFCQPQLGVDPVKTVETGAPQAGVRAAVGNIQGEFVAGNDIGNVTAVLGSLVNAPGVIVEFRAGNDIGVLSAGNDITDIRVQAGGDLAGLDAGDDIGGIDADIAGALAYVTAGNDIDDSEIEVGSVGDITAETGHIHDATIHAAGDPGVVGDIAIGRVSASLFIEGEFIAEAGSIGDGTDAFVSDAGDIDIVAIAGENIDNVTAHTGNIMSTVDTLSVDLDGLVLEIDLSAVGGLGIDLEGAGELKLSVAEVNGLLRAGGTIGDVSAFNDIGNYVVQAGVDVGDISTTVGQVGAPEIIDLNELLGFSFTTPDIALVEMGMLTVVANGSVGNVSSALDVGVGDETMVINGIAITIDNSPVTLHAVNGSIGNIASVGGSIVNLEAVANLAIGNVTASEDILGRYIVEDGAIGDIVSQVGDIGAADEPIVVKANGGVAIDPYSLEYVHIVNGSVLDGVGTVYAEIGDIFAEIETGGSVGVVGAAPTDPVLGGIAAPLGQVDLYLRVGGHVGGLSGQSVDLDPDSVILGSIGILRNIESGGGTVQGVNPDNPLIIISEGVDYRVIVADGTASVTYAVTAGELVFSSIAYDPGVAGDIAVRTTTGGRQASGAFEDSPVQVVVEEMVVNGTVADITIEGDVLELTVDGDLVGGTLWVQGSAGDIDVAGDLGDGDADANRFAADNMVIRIDELDPRVFSLDVAGTNYGLQDVPLNAWEWLTWQNTMDVDGDGDTYITVFLGAGQANLTINNGYLETVALANGYAGNLVVVTSDSDFGETLGDLDPTAYVGTNWQNAITLFLQPVMADLGVNSIAAMYDNEVFEGGSVSIGSNDTAHVGRIVGEGGDGLWLVGAVVEGNVGSVDASTTPSGVVNVTIAGNVGEVRGMSNSCVAGLDVRGDAGVIESLIVQNVDVNGSVGRIQATTSMSRVRIGGNAGIVDGGSLLTNVQVGGSAISVSGGSIWDVEVGGSIGVSFSDGAPDTLDLGSDFTAEEVADLLGTSVAGLNAIADVGPNGSRTLGGLEANVLGRVSVGGAITDVTVRLWADAGSGLLGKAVDDAFIRGGWNGNWVKEDGELIEWPGMLG